MKTYTIEAWSLRSSAASHTDRILTGTVTVKGETEESALKSAAFLLDIPADFWLMPRAGSSALAYKRVKFAFGKRPVVTSVPTGQQPFVVLRFVQPTRAVPRRFENRPRIAEGRP